MKIYIILFASMFVNFTKAQSISGKVYEQHGEHQHPLVGVNIYWSGTSIGTTSDAKGEYQIERINESQILVFSYVGYKTDSIAVSASSKLDVNLKESELMKEVLVSERQSASTIERMSPNLSQNISGEAFHRAACCNLSESFETNASVDVSYADALTGSKQIKMLGLDGKYVQIQTENIPSMSGLASSFGLTYIPGPWMESIQVSKGASSVKNGFQSISGQINAEYKKPDKADPLLLNLVANDAFGYEANAVVAKKLSKKWSALLAVHWHQNQMKHDRNHDSFLDQPLINRLQIFNRWKYKSDDYIFQFGASVIEEDRIGGQVDFEKAQAINITSPYGIGIHTNRAEVFAKGGYVFPSKPLFSVAFLSNASYHMHESFYGLQAYNAEEKSAFGALLYEGIINNANHQFSTGLDYRFDQVQEWFNDSSATRTEYVPGAYFEYTYLKSNWLTMMLGLRANYHNRYGFFATPRWHLRYQINEHNTLRASAGMGYRTANVLVEQPYLLANGARMSIADDFRMERAINYGLSYVKKLHVFEKEWTFIVDFFRTDFQNQLVVDREQLNRIEVYNLDGASYSNAFQIEWQAEIIKRLDATIAYRYNDVKTSYRGDLLEVPLVNRFKGLVALSYATNLKKWQFDINMQINGDGRLPGYRDGINERFPVYSLTNIQITKFFRKWSVYLGAENLFDYVQENPIIAPDQPYSNTFDASQVWGPIHGRKIYIGLRYSIRN
ncbi:MAG: TonB-dependent receptor [Bacteroidales bacterium]|nr:TonB-dependent receptor [Bacteroidales bacterium]